MVDIVVAKCNNKQKWKSGGENNIPSPHSTSNPYSIAYIHIRIILECTNKNILQIKHVRQLICGCIIYFYPTMALQRTPSDQIEKKYSERNF